MGRRFYILIVLSILLVCAVQPVRQVAADDPPIVSTATVEGRLAVFDDVWETIQTRYYDRSHNGIDWQAKRDLFRPAAAKANSDRLAGGFVDAAAGCPSLRQDKRGSIYRIAEK